MMKIIKNDEIFFCQKHGEKKSPVISFGGEILSPQSCDECDDEKRTVEEKEQEMLCLQKQEQKKHFLREQSNIPKRYKTSSLLTFKVQNKKQKIALEICENFVENFEKEEGKNLILLGKPGTGKTHLACAVMHKIIANFIKPALFVNFSQKIAEIVGSYRATSPKAKNEILSELAAVDLLLIDDLGCAIQTEHTQEVINSIISERYDLKKSTIITANLNCDQLVNYCGTRVSSRLHEAIKNAGIFDWNDFRKIGDEKT